MGSGLPLVASLHGQQLPIGASTVTGSLLSDGQCALLGAMAMLAIPQLLRKPFQQLLGRDAASNLRQGGGPVVLFLSLAAAMPDGMSAGTSPLGRVLVNTFTALILAAPAAAPERQWPPLPHPFNGSKLHAGLNIAACIVLGYILLRVIFHGCNG